MDFVKDVGEEAHMPFSVGEGIKTIEGIRSIISAGAEEQAHNKDFARAVASRSMFVYNEPKEVRSLIIPKRMIYNSIPLNNSFKKEGI